MIRIGQTRKVSVARSARIEETSPLKSNLPVVTKVRKAVSAEVKTETSVSPRPLPQSIAPLA